MSRRPDESATLLRNLLAESASGSGDDPFGHGYWRGYNEALDLAVRVIEDRHTLEDGTCFECDELGIEHKEPEPEPEPQPEEKSA